VAPDNWRKTNTPPIATSNGLRKYLETQKKPGIVRTALRYAPDGTGRVWLLKETP
jgi:hypothetical protein